MLSSQSRLHSHNQHGTLTSPQMIEFYNIRTIYADKSYKQSWKIARRNINLMLRYCSFHRGGLRLTTHPVSYSVSYFETANKPHPQVNDCWCCSAELVTTRSAEVNEEASSETACCMTTMWRVLAAAADEPCQRCSVL